MTTQPLPVLNIDAMARVLEDHEQIWPDPEAPPGLGTMGGAICQCGSTLGQTGPDIYKKLARHQAEMLTARPDVYVVTEISPTRTT